MTRQELARVGPDIGDNASNVIRPAQFSAGHTPEERALLAAMVKLRGQRFVDSHAGVIIAQAKAIGDV